MSTPPKPQIAVAESEQAFAKRLREHYQAHEYLTTSLAMRLAQKEAAIAALNRTVMAAVSIDELRPVLCRLIVMALPL